MEVTHVRQKFLRYGVEDVKDMTDLPLLHDLKEWYNPSSQPRTAAEWNYVSAVLRAVYERLKELRCACCVDDDDEGIGMS